MRGDNCGDDVAEPCGEASDRSVPGGSDELEADEDKVIPGHNTDGSIEMRLCCCSVPVEVNPAPDPERCKCECCWPPALSPNPGGANVVEPPASPAPPPTPFANPPSDATGLSRPPADNPLLNDPRPNELPSPCDSRLAKPKRELLREASSMSPVPGGLGSFECSGPSSENGESENGSKEPR